MGEVRQYVIYGNRTPDVFKLHKRLLDETGNYFIHLRKGVYTEGLSISNIAKAHKNVVQDAKDNDCDYCVIMEDDVSFPVKKEAYKYFLDSMSKLPKDWDIYTSGFYTVNTFEQDFENIYRISGFAGLHLYCVNKKFYDTFLSCPPAVNIDQWISQPGRGNCYCCYPFAAIQQEGFSENVGRVVSYSHLLEGRKIYPNF